MESHVGSLKATYERDLGVDRLNGADTSTRGKELDLPDLRPARNNYERRGEKDLGDDHPGLCFCRFAFVKQKSGWRLLRQKSKHARSRGRKDHGFGEIHMSGATLVL